MPDALYDRIGVGYSARRRPDERIAARVSAALGGCERVLNVGAGTGSYEPNDRFVVAIEPSAEMIRQRPATAAPVIQAVADRLPFRDRSFDAVLAVLTIHHWPKAEEGLAEMRRIARDRVVILTWNPEHSGFWLVQEYFPEIVEIDRRIFPTVHAIERAIGPVETHVVPVPADCRDGFLGAYWRRPAEYLKAEVRAAMSAFQRIDATIGLERLDRDLDDGSWLERHRALQTISELDIGYRLFVAPRAPGAGVTVRFNRNSGTSVEPNRNTGTVAARRRLRRCSGCLILALLAGSILSAEMGSAHRPYGFDNST